MRIYPVIAGIILLLFGRKLFWLFLGIAGFLFGMEITPLFFGGQPQWLQLCLALGMGCLGALLAMLAQRVAFAFAGFSAGMYLALMLAPSFAGAESDTVLLIAIGAGIIGAVCAALIMDSAITILACLIGAGAIVGELHTDHSLQILAFVILAVSGFLFQEKLFPEAKNHGQP